MTRQPGSRPRVVVVGDLGLDVLSRATDRVVPGHDTRAATTIVPGGAGANTAAWLARCGAEVTLIARIGDDHAGRTAAAGLAAAGVDCRLTVDPELPTCCIVVVVEPDGERTMLSDRGANARLDPADLDLSGLPGGSHLHLSGYPLLDASSRAAGLAALAAARAAGWTTSVDPQSATHLAGVGPSAFLDWIGGVDLLLPNESELEMLGGVAGALQAVGAVACTHGSRGASWHTAGESVTVPAIPVRQPDSTGAGDAFNAGVLAAWLSGAAPRDALLAGVRAGSAAAAQLGAWPAPL
ncbi:MAG TPA: carbohydrate kinase family protein [Nakamurella sp.]|nr:carbohydrate kinase family protein [Nakamurella sp.]